MSLNTKLLGRASDATDIDDDLNLPGSPDKLLASKKNGRK